MKSRLWNTVCACALFGSSAAYGASFTGLGVSTANVSPDGNFLFNDTDRWTEAGGWQTWDSYSGGTLTGGVSEVSYDGSAVAGSVNGTAYRWTASSGMVGLGSFPGNYSFSVSGISADGSVVAGTGTDTTPNSEVTQAYRWTAGTGMVGLGSSSGSNANAISADGTAVLGLDLGIPGASTGYWTPDGTWVELAEGPNTNFTATSSDASVIAGDFNFRGVFRWTATDGFQGLETNGARQYAKGMSYDGNFIVGAVSHLSNGNDGWLWDATNGTRRIQDVLTAEGIDLSGWDFFGSTAYSISADGSIITGAAKNSSGVSEAWVADFSVVPVPPALYLFGSGLIGLVGMARRKAMLPGR